LHAAGTVFGTDRSKEADKVDDEAGGILSGSTPLHCLPLAGPSRLWATMALLRQRQDFHNEVLFAARKFSVSQNPFFCANMLFKKGFIRVEPKKLGDSSSETFFVVVIVIIIVVIIVFLLIPGIVTAGCVWNEHPPLAPHFSSSLLGHGSIGTTPSCRRAASRS
jgi:hypothetical protein